jgi:hypothetical protein
MLRNILAAIVLAASAVSLAWSAVLYWRTQRDVDPHVPPQFLTGLPSRFTTDIWVHASWVPREVKERYRRMVFLTTGGWLGITIFCWAIGQYAAAAGVGALTLLGIGIRVDDWNRRRREWRPPSGSA